MALAIRFEELLSSHEVADYSELANRYGVDRGRISRVMHLRLLAPDLQEHLLSIRSETSLSLKALLPVCKTCVWEDQRREFNQLVTDSEDSSDGRHMS